MRQDFSNLLNGDFINNREREILTVEAKRVLLCKDIVGSFKDDFTILIERTSDSDDEVEKLLKFYQPKGQSAEHSFNYQLDDSEKGNIKLDLLSSSKKYSYESDLWICNSTKSIFAHGRMAACLSRQTKQWSITFRKKEGYTVPNQTKQSNGNEEAPPISEYLNKKSEQIYNTLYNIIFSDDKPKNGLVVIAGRTGSMKSQVANGFIEEYLSKRMKNQPERVPHLLTYEDPIEKIFESTAISKADYTPREKNKDTPNLNEVIDLALRQTPAILFVGETRDPKDWESLLRFAGTGHLVITTTHAGSLTEAMENIFQATKSHTPAARNVVADRLLALIHLRPETILLPNDPNKKMNILLPALWHRTPNGVKALMAEGLSSLLPNTHKVEKKKNNYPSSIGRYWFAGKLLEESKNFARKLPKLKEEQRLKKERTINAINTFEKKILQTAIEFDLGGI